MICLKIKYSRPKTIIEFSIFISLSLVVTKNICFLVISTFHPYPCMSTIHVMEMMLWNIGSCWWNINASHGDLSSYSTDALDDILSTVNAATWSHSMLSRDRPVSHVTIGIQSKVKSIVSILLKLSILTYQRTYQRSWFKFDQNSMHSHSGKSLTDVQSLRV